MLGTPQKLWEVWHWLNVLRVTKSKGFHFSNNFLFTFYLGVQWTMDQAEMDQVYYQVLKQEEQYCDSLTEADFDFFFDGVPTASSPGIIPNGSESEWSN
jgi:hypothetical protein